MAKRSREIESARERISPRRKATKLIAQSDPRRKDQRFWLHDEPHTAIFSTWKRIGDRTRARRLQDVYHACLYDDDELIASMNLGGAIGEFTPQTLATNVVRRQVDTYVAKIAKNRPVPMGLTSGGTYSEQRRAKALSKFFEGQLDEAEYWTTRELRLRDGGIFGDGFALNWRDGRKINHDRFFSMEARVDPRDARSGKPRTLYIGRYIDRLVAQERWPKFATELETADAKTSDDAWELGWDETCDLVFIIEVWHLASSEVARDGQHFIACSNATLERHDYVRDYFPISKFSYSPPVFGWYGTGLVRQLAGLQFEINSVGLRLQERQYLMGTYIYHESGGELNFDDIDNGTMTEITGSGGPPVFLQPPPAHAQTLDWYTMLRKEMPGEITGISGLSTRAEKPAGIDSGKALRTYHDIDTENLVPVGRADERDVIGTCWQFFDLAEEIYAETGKTNEDRKAEKQKPYIVRVEERRHGKTKLRELDYAKVRLDRQDFVLRVFPTNFLRGTPEDQMQAVNEMIKAGFLSQDEALVLLDFPDLQRVLNLRNAARTTIEKILEQILDASDPESAYVYPEEAMNLELCKALGIMTYLENFGEAPEANLKKVLQFAVDAANKLTGADTTEPGPDAAVAAGEAPLDPSMDPTLDPNALPPPDAGGPAPAPPELYAPPPVAPLPAGAVPPGPMPVTPPV